MKTKNILDHFTPENALSYNDVVGMTSEQLKSVVSVCWHENSLRCYAEGISTVNFDSIRQTINWSDNDGDPSIENYNPDQKIHQLGDGEWDYGIYKPFDF